MEVDEVLDAAVIGAQPLFAGLSDEVKERILGLARRIELDEDHRIVTEDTLGDSAYILVEGRVCVVQRGRQVRELGPGSVFGELSLIDGAPRSATIVTMTPVVCLELQREHLWRLFEEQPSVMAQVMRGLVMRLRELERPIDRLTGLPNRMMFEELLAMALSRAERSGSAVAVLHVGLDGFRLVNEGLGSVEADRILMEVTARLAVSSPGTVSRAGDDEFLILVADVDGTGADDRADEDDPGFIAAEAAAHAVADLLRKPFVSGEQEIVITASTGAAIFPRYSENATTLMRDAATAMRESKEDGPGGHLVSTKGTGDPEGRLQLVNDLRRAVEANSWKLLYQPVVGLLDGKLVGVEALVRWERDGELVSPAVFIQLAEDLGFIDAIGDWVMEESCRQSQVWRDEGLDLRMSFNLSPRELRCDDLVERLTALLEKYGVPPTQMVVEVTETSMETLPDLVRGVLGRLAIAGMGISIDDFGTGYSSLSRLKDMPISTLKIDRSFVSELPDHDGAVNVVRAVIRLAESLRMVSLAEGIETPEQRSMLTTLGCQLGQGYLFAKPLPPERILEIAREGGRPMGEG